MTELLVARVNNVLKGADGSLERVHKGVTLAEAGHPVAQANPQAFQPVTIHLPDPSGPLEDEVAEEVAEVEAERDVYRQALAQVVDVLDDLGAIPAGTDRTREGWLAEAVESAIRGLRTQLDEAAPAEPVAPPRAASKPRKTAAKPAPAAGDGA